MIHSEVNNINVPTFIQRNYIFFIKKHVPTLYLFFPCFNHQTPRLPWSPRLPVRGPGEEQDFIAVAQGDGRIA